MKFLLILFTVAISFAAMGQAIIKGIVHDKNGAVPGVTVTEMGSNNKVITDAKGEFEIQTATNSPTLTFTFVGFLPRTIKVKKNKFLKVKLKWDRPKSKHIS